MTNLAMFGALRASAPRACSGRCSPKAAARWRPRPRSAASPRASQPGAIVDLHDADGVPGAGARLVEALPDLIDALRQRGFALAPLRDLL